MTISDPNPTTRRPSPIRVRGAGTRRFVGFGIAGGIVAALLAVQYFGAREKSAMPGNIAWQTNLATALSEARKTGKPALLDFSASWCPPCQAMKHDAWPDAEVGRAVTSGFVPVFLDVDGSEGQSASQRYGVEFIPTLVVVDADGKVLRRAGFMQRDQLLAFLQRPSAGQ
jgi:thiol:disulfide interchange protein